MKQKLCLGVLLVGLSVWAFAQQTAPAQNGAPTSLPGAISKVYKTIGETQLYLHIYQPAERQSKARLPAIVFFFGGGWRQGSPAQFVEHCKHLATRGMVAITAEYRVKSRHNVTPLECIADAKSAMRWVRAHAAELGIDADRIAAGGGSAGGHLAAAVATVREFDDKTDDLKVSPLPQALVLFNPALDLNGISGDFGFGDKKLAASPLQNVRKGAPPTIIFHGTADTTVPFDQATRFCAELTKLGSRCEVKGYEGRTHGFFNYGRGNNEDFKTTLRAADEFLTSLGWLKGKPAL
jgi:acetyl esterase/lipase